MTDAYYEFVPFSKRGIAAVGDMSKHPDTGRLSAEVTLTLGAYNDGNKEKEEEVVKTLNIYGPGDISGFDTGEIIKTTPEPGDNEWEVNRFCSVEFHDPDLLWRFTPSSISDMRSDKKQAIPWLTLLVLSRGPAAGSKEDAVAAAAEYSLGSNSSDSQPLPEVRINKTIVAEKMPLPVLEESWRTAHVQVIADPGQPAPIESASDKNAKLTELEKNEPQDTSCRVMCFRRLKPFTKYTGFLVPTFKAGVQSGLGDAVTAYHDELAWNSDFVINGKDISLPYYFKYDFATGDRGDFESLLTLLQPRTNVELQAYDVGKLKVDTTDLGDALSLASGAADEKFPKLLAGESQVLGVETALRNLGDKPVIKQSSLFNAGIKDILDETFTLVADRVAPPIYGRWHRPTRRFPCDHTWINELNINVQRRLSAGLGGKMIRKNQEQYMEAAWDQLGDLPIINQDIHAGLLATYSTFKLSKKWLKPARAADLVRGGFLQGTSKAMTAKKGVFLKRHLKEKSINYPAGLQRFLNPVASRARTSKSDYSLWKGMDNRIVDLPLPVPANCRRHFSVGENDDLALAEFAGTFKSRLHEGDIEKLLLAADAAEKADDGLIMNREVAARILSAFVWTKGRPVGNGDLTRFAPGAQKDAGFGPVADSDSESEEDKKPDKKPTKPAKKPGFKFKGKLRFSMKKHNHHHGGGKIYTSQGHKKMVKVKDPEVEAEVDDKPAGNLGKENSKNIHRRGKPGSRGTLSARAAIRRDDEDIPYQRLYRWQRSGAKSSEVKPEKGVRTSHKLAAKSPAEAPFLSYSGTAPTKFTSAYGAKISSSFKIRSSRFADLVQVDKDEMEQIHAGIEDILEADAAGNVRSASTNQVLKLDDRTKDSLTSARDVLDGLLDKGKVDSKTVKSAFSKLSFAKKLKMASFSKSDKAVEAKFERKIVPHVKGGKLAFRKAAPKPVALAAKTTSGETMPDTKSAAMKKKSAARASSSSMKAITKTISNVNRNITKIARAVVENAIAVSHTKAVELPSNLTFGGGKAGGKGESVAIRMPTLLAGFRPGVIWVNPKPTGHIPDPDDDDELESAKNSIILSTHPAYSLLPNVQLRYPRLPIVCRPLPKPDHPMSEAMKPGRYEPIFNRPMWEDLYKENQNYIMAGLDKIPDNTIAVFESNQAFIESYMCGLNVHMAQEMLWREYPAIMNGTFFKVFWDYALIDAFKDEPTTDIDPIKLWKSKLGRHQPEDSDAAGVVLLVKGQLLKRYPNTNIYATKATNKTSAGVEQPWDEAPWPVRGDEVSPVFNIQLKPDITLLGFALSVEEALGDGENDPGYFFVFEEKMGELEFGLEVDGPGEEEKFAWSHFNDIAAGEYLDQEGANTPKWQNIWNDSSAAVAAHTANLPVRRFYLASDFLADT